MYDVVFEDVLVKIEYVRAPRPVPKGEFPIDDAVATIALTRWWRGSGPDTVVVRTALHACGLGFQQGEGYLLFARKAAPFRSMPINAGPAGAGVRRLSGWLGFWALEIAFSEA